MKLGADVDELDQLGAAYERCAQLVEGARSSVGTQLAATAWVGPNADAFRQRWHGATTRTLLVLTSDLRDAADHVRAQAAQQRAASAGGPGGGSGGGSGPGRGGSSRGGGRPGGQQSQIQVPSDWVLGLGLFAGGLEGFRDHMMKHDNVGKMALEAVRHGIEPAMKGTGLYGFVRGAEKGAKGFGHLITFGEQTYGQWVSDADAGYGGAEGYFRGLAVGGVNAGADMLAVKAFGAVGFAIGGPPGMIVGGVVGSFAVHAIRSEVGQEVNEAVAGAVSAVADVGRSTGEGLVDIGQGLAAGADELRDQVRGAAKRTAREAVDAVSAPIEDVGRTVRGWFGG